MSLLRLAWSCLLITLAAGCQPEDGPTSLDGVSGLHVRVDGFASEDADGLRAASLRVAVTGNDDCFQVGPGFHASLGATRGTLVIAGDATDYWCETPSFVVDVAAQAGALPRTLVFGDLTRTVEVDLGDLLAAQDASLATPADGVLRAGQPIEIAWTPPLRLQPLEIHLLLSYTEIPWTRDTATGHLRSTASGPFDQPVQDELTVSASMTAPIEVPCADASCVIDMSWYTRLGVTTTP